MVNTIRLLSKGFMIFSLKPRVKAIILDMDGVLWQENRPIGDLPAVFAYLRSLDINFIFVTNNSTKSIAQYQEKFAKFGVSINKNQIISSGIATKYYLKKRFPYGGPIHIIGEQGLFDTLTEADFYQSDKDVLAVVVGLNRELTYNLLKKATLLIRDGAAFIGTNPDTTFPTPEGFIPGAGAILAALESATEVQPVVIGKPNFSMFELALERLQLQPSEVLMIGDRLDTDILGGQKAGLRTGLVLTGISKIDEIKNWVPAPDLVAPDLESILGMKKS